MPSVMHAVTNFVNAIVGIFVQLFNSIFAVFHAIFALGLDVVNSMVTIVQHLVAMVLDLFQGVLGFVTGEFLSSVGRERCVCFLCADVHLPANFIAIGLIVGAYFAYTQYVAKNGGTTKRRA